MSPLKKVYIRRIDAEKVVNQVLTRDMTKIAPEQSAYGAVPGETCTGKAGRGDYKAYPGIG